MFIRFDLFVHLNINFVINRGNVCSEPVPDDMQLEAVPRPRGWECIAGLHPHIDVLVNGRGYPHVDIISDVDT